MELTISKEGLEQIINYYYKKNYDMEGQINVGCYTTYEGTRHEEITEMQFIYQATMSIGDLKVPCKKELTIDIIKKILKRYLEENGYQLDSISIDGTIRNGRGNENIPYFNGINVKIKQKQIQKTIGTIK